MENEQEKSVKPQPKPKVAKEVKKAMKPEEKTEVPPEIIVQIQAQQEAKRRAEVCMQEMQMVLKKHNCVLDPVILIDGRGLQRSWQIVANPAQAG